VFAVSGTSLTPYYHNPDSLNAPHVLTDGSGNPVWTWDHLAFGDNAPNQNPSGLGVFNYNPRFPGQYADAESGLSYNMARDYNPGLGRYMQSDPIGLNGGINTYGYVKGNPITRIDPTGRLWPEIVGVGIIGILTIETVNSLSHPPEIPQTPIPPPAGKFCTLYDPKGLSIPSGAVLMSPVPAPVTQPEIPEPPEPPEWPSD
jgi:RHS repeat-associated protein